MKVAPIMIALFLSMEVGMMAWYIRTTLKPKGSLLVHTGYQVGDESPDDEKDVA